MTRLPDELIFETVSIFRRGLAGGHDSDKARHLEAWAADERAIDVGLGDEPANVVRFHAAPVEDATAIRRLGAEPLPESPPDVRMRFLGLRGARVPAGADGPHRLVRQNEIVEIVEIANL